MIQSEGSKTRLGFGYLKTRVKKQSEYYIYGMYIALAITVLIMFLTESFFPNFILEDGLLTDFQRSISSTEAFYSNTAGMYLDPEVVRSSLMTEILNSGIFAIFYFFIVLITSFVIVYPFYNRYITKEVEGLTDDNVLTGTEVLEDERYLSKLKELGEESEDSFTLSKVYKFNEVRRVPKKAKIEDLDTRH